MLKGFWLMRTQTNNRSQSAPIFQQKTFDHCCEQNMDQNRNFTNFTSVIISSGCIPSQFCLQHLSSLRCDLTRSKHATWAKKTHCDKESSTTYHNKQKNYPQVDWNYRLHKCFIPLDELDLETQSVEASTARLVVVSRLTMVAWEWRLWYSTLPGHLGCFGLVQAFALFLARRAPTALASSLYSLGRREERNKRPAGWVRSQWRNPVASQPYIKQLTHRQRNHCNAEKAGKLNPFNLASCQVWISYWTPWYQRSGSETYQRAIRFFSAWLENGNEPSPFCPFQIDHCTSVSNQTSASPKRTASPKRSAGQALG